MRKISLFILLLLSTPLLLHAQWMQRSQPYGGGAYSFLQTQSGLSTTYYAGTRNGVYSSVDGSNWTAAGLQGFTIYRMLEVQGAVGGSSNVMLAAEFHRLFRTTDGGATWTKVFTSSGRIQSLTQSGTTLFMAVAMDVESNNDFGLYSSTDGGLTWTALPTNPKLGTVRSVVSIGNYLVAATRYGGVLRSTDMGMKWAQTNYRATDSIWSMQVVHSPLGGLGLLVAGQGGLYGSTDSGMTWGHFPSSGIDTLGQALHSFAVNGLTVVAFDDRDSAYISNNGGLNWSPLTGLNGFPTSGINYGVASMGGKFYIGTAEGILSSTTGTSWSYADQGITGATIRDLTYQNGTLFALTYRGVYRSTDQGLTWSTLSTGDLQNSGASHFLQVGNSLYAYGSGLSSWNGTAWQSTSALPISSVAQVTGSSGTTWFGSVGTGGVVMSTNFGSSWVNVSGTTLPKDSLKTTFVFSSGNNLYAFANKFADARGLIFQAPVYVFMSSDMGATWTRVGGLSTGPESINGAVTTAQGIYLATSNGLYLSTTNGASWTVVNSIPTDANVTFLRAFNGMLAAGISGSTTMADGLYTSVDGSSWTYQSLGVQSSPTAFATDNQNLYIGTSASGIYVESITSLGVGRALAVSAAKLQVTVGPNPVTSLATVRFELEHSDRVQLNVFDNKGSLVTTVTDRSYGAGSNEAQIDLGTLAQGTYTLVLRAGEKTGMTRIVVEH